MVEVGQFVACFACRKGNAWKCIQRLQRDALLVPQGLQKFWEYCPLQGTYNYLILALLRIGASEWAEHLWHRVGAAEFYFLDLPMYLVQRRHIVCINVAVMCPRPWRTKLSWRCGPTRSTCTVCRCRWLGSLVLQVEILRVVRGDV